MGEGWMRDVEGQRRDGRRMMEGLREGCVRGGMVKNGRGFVKVGEWMEEGLERMDKEARRVGKNLGRMGWARMVEQSENGKRRTEDGRGRRVRIGKVEEG